MRLLLQGSQMGLSSVVGCGAANKGKTENSILGIKKVNFNYLEITKLITPLLKAGIITFPIISSTVPCYSITDCLLYSTKIGYLQLRGPGWLHINISKLYMLELPKITMTEIRLNLAFNILWIFFFSYYMEYEVEMYNTFGIIVIQLLNVIA